MPANGEEEGRLKTASNWLAGSIVVATGIFAVAGATGGNLNRVIRIHPQWFALAIGLLVVAITLGVASSLTERERRKRQIIVLGLFSFLAGTVVLAYVNAQTTGEQERPTVSAVLTHQQDDLTLKANVLADGLELRQYVWIVVEGMNEQAALDWRTAKTAPNYSKPRDDYYIQRVYTSRVGPDASGAVDLPFEVVLSKGLYQRVRVTARIYSAGEVAPGAVEDSTERGKYACHSQSGRTSCAELLIPSADTYERTDEE